jgi:hypothetical protein
MRSLIVLCPHPHESGHQHVDVVGGFCHAGEGCVERCPFAWKRDSPRTTSAEAAWKEMEQVRVAEKR